MTPHSSTAAGLPPGITNTDPSMPRYTELEEGQWNKETLDYTRLNYEGVVKGLIREGMTEAGVPEELREDIEMGIWQGILKGGL